MGAYRESIFQLRAQGLSQRQIAAHLGISKTLVVKELDRPANQVESDDPDPAPPGVTAPGLTDPLADSARRARLTLEAERAEVATLQLQAQKLELQRRMQLLAAPNDGNNSVLLAILAKLDSLGRPAAGTPGLSLTEQLSQVRAVQETVQSFAPPAMTGPDALAYQTAGERLKQESRDLEIRREWERADRDEKLAIERRRADAFATVIEQWGPVIGAGIQTWLERQSQPPAPAGRGLAVLQGGQGKPALPAPWAAAPPSAAPGPPAAEVDGAAEPAAGAEIVGACPRCRTTIAIAAEGPDSCPVCGLEVQNRNGRIFGDPRVAIDPPSFTG